MKKSGPLSLTSSVPSPSSAVGPRVSVQQLEGPRPAEIGRRLRNARETAGLTQTDAAQAIQVARTTLLAIEKGQRRLQPVELQKLATFYGSSANELLRRECVHIDLVPRFRKHGRYIDEKARDAAQLLTTLVRAEVELEDILGVRHVRNYPPERPLRMGDVRVQAETDAMELRQRMGLGLAPVRDLIGLLELEFGMRVYVRRVGPRVSGLFAYGREVGACVLLNGNHPWTRRTLTAAHELAHMVSVRREPSIHYHRHEPTSREERYADAFARTFLMPPRAVIERFHEQTAGFSALTRRHVILLSHTFGVSREAMVRRLEELELLSPGAWDWFQDNGGISDKQVAEVLGDLAPAHLDAVGNERCTAPRIAALAAEAHRHDLLSEGQLARLLDVSRIAVRQLLDEEAVGGKASAAPQAPR